ncbi:MAG: glycosyltransferase family 2 protein [Fibrobacteres bacterium]|jgi:hypothetical protein|nr:glycosyltransferase family 2 protein [Fibrobacterota bacterium]
MRLAPVALFVYNRLDHALRTLEALRANPLAAESELTIFSDGPKRESDLPKVQALRAALRDLRGFKRAVLVERESNLGLSRSIVGGVTDLVRAHGRVIVLEDDMVTSPHFLRYMNDGLELYRDDGQVASIAAYIFPVRRALPETFFLRGADCWGWATWARAWSHFDPDGPKLLAELRARKLTREFDLDGAYPYTRMLKRQIAGKNDSWAIRWYATAFLKGMLTLYPGVSMLNNIGNDGGGTHNPDTAVFDVEVADRRLRVERLPLAENLEGRRAVADYFRRTRRRPGVILRKILWKIRRG